MRNAINSFLFTLVLGLCLSAPAFGQKQQPRPTPTPTPQEQDEGPIRIKINRVRLPITVLDKKNVPVPGLTKQDFVILEDKQQVAIETFDDESENQPLFVGVLMDTSGSTKGKIKFEQEAAINFIQTVMRPRKDRAAFLTFDDEVNLRQDFTDRLDLLDKAVYAVKKHGERTALYDAVWQFCNEKMRTAQGRRALVIITDGDDTYSRADLRDAIDIAQRTETTVFAISTKAGFLATVPGVEAGEVMDSGDKDLVKLCEETGGMALFTGDMLALERAFKRIATELRAQYIVTYKPLNDRYDGSFRRIEVRLSNARGGMKVRTRKGYTAVADTVRP